MSETWKDLTSAKLSLKLLKIFFFLFFVLELQHFTTLLMFSLRVPNFLRA